MNAFRVRFITLKNSNITVHWASNRFITFRKLKYQKRIRVLLMKAFKPNAWTNIFWSIQLKYEFLIQTQNGIFNKAAHHLHCSLCESWHSLHGFVQIIRHESLCFACYYMYPSHRQNKTTLQSYLKTVGLYLNRWGRRKRKRPPSISCIRVSIWCIRVSQWRSRDKWCTPQESSYSFHSRFLFCK